LLADTPQLQCAEIFAPEAKIIAERKLWIAVMRAQSTLGHAIPKDVITDYENVITQVDLASIDAREKAEPSRCKGTD
jgi:adenylosuccinate lyase